MFQYGLFDERDMAQLADATLEVLASVGVLCQNDEMLDALAAWGATVDRTAQTARFPRRLVEAFAAGLRAEATRGEMGPTAHTQTVRQDYSVRQSATEPAAARLRAPAMPTLGTQVAQFYYDDMRQERRPGNRADFITLIKFGDALHRADGVGHCLLLQDVPPLLEPLMAAVLLAEYAHHPGPAFVWNVRQVDYLREMGETLGFADWFTWGAICFSHPLRFDRDVADKFVRRARSGVATGLTGMQVAGATTPITVAGYVVVSAAEFVATWIAARALHPTVPLCGSIWGGTLDMKGGNVSYSAPDAMLRAFAVAEFLRRWCGQEVVVGGGEYCDARAPGLYAAREKAYKAMTIAAFTGQHPQVGEGMLETGKTISPVQLLLDREVTRELQALAADFAVTPEAIGLDAIREVGFGLETNYLQTEHTLRHFRAAAWIPSLLDRSGGKDRADEEALLARAREQVRALIASYVKPEVDPDTLARLRAVVERAKRELLG